jgi:hypothetical protein
VPCHGATWKSNDGGARHYAQPPRASGGREGYARLATCKRSIACCTSWMSVCLVAARERASV